MEKGADESKNEPGQKIESLVWLYWAILAVICFSINGFAMMLLSEFGPIGGKCFLSFGNVLYGMIFYGITFVRRYRQKGYLFKPRRSFFCDLETGVFQPRVLV